MKKEKKEEDKNYKGKYLLYKMERVWYDWYNLNMVLANYPGTSCMIIADLIRTNIWFLNITAEVPIFCSSLFPFFEHEK